MTTNYKGDVIIAGAGLAGIVTALELLDQGKKIVLLDRDVEDKFGGLAKWSFGGMFFVNTPNQRKTGIRDNIDLAFRDWCSFAEFGPDDHIPKQWAEFYVNKCTEDVYNWLKKRDVGFFPIVHWVERGLLQPGNSVPRFHMVWGTGHWLAVALINQLKNHKNADNCRVFFKHKVDDIVVENGVIKGVTGINEELSQPFTATADVVVVASGGVTGSIKKVKENWYKPWGSPPETILNGSHPVADGLLHDLVQTKMKANVTHMDKYWHYAAGVHHPKPEFEGHGLSIVPPKSALWMNYKGERMGPMPLVSAYDTRSMVQRICQEEKKYSWQIMNMKIMIKELAISGSEANEAIKNKQLLKFLMNILFGNKKLANDLVNTCEDVVVAYSIEELAEKMNKLTGTNDVDVEALREGITLYDNQIDRGPKFHNDEQLRRITHLRQYRGDKARVCKYQKIFDKSAMPLVAMREFILSRKTLGGIQTDIESRVLNKKYEPISGLYAVGEAAGFGGGGMHGLRALEGTFLGGCVLNGRQAAKSIADRKSTRLNSSHTDISRRPSAA